MTGVAMGYAKAGVAVNEIRHGYTLDDLDHLARAAVLNDRFARLGDFADDYEGRYATAWDAVAYALCEADHRPTPRDLHTVALKALREEHDARRRHHGVRDNARSFDVYWREANRAAGSPEKRVVEATAVAQIWPELAPYQQRAFKALAALDSYEAAAEACGVTYKTFLATISQGRRRFLELWHEGEKPSRPWGSDRRRTPGKRQSPVTRVVKHRNGPRQEPTKATVAAQARREDYAWLRQSNESREEAARRVGVGLETARDWDRDLGLAGVA